MLPRPPVDDSEILKQIHNITQTLTTMKVDNETMQQIRKNLRDEFIKCNDLQQLNEKLDQFNRILNKIRVFQESPLPYDVIKDKAEFEKSMNEIGYEEAGKNIQSIMMAAKSEIYQQTFDNIISALKGAPEAIKFDLETVNRYLDACSKAMTLSTDRLLNAIDSTMKMHQTQYELNNNYMKFLEKSQETYEKIHYSKKVSDAKMKRMDGAMLTFIGCALVVTGIMLTPISMGLSIPMCAVGGWILGLGVAKLATSKIPATPEKMLSKASAVVIDVQANIANADRKHQLEYTSEKSTPPAANKR